MSLLMDALKRAEEAKRQRSDEGSAPPAGELQLEAVPGPAKDSRNSPLPDLSSHLDSVEAELKAAAEQPGKQGKPTHPKPDSSIDRAVAQKVLAASSTGYEKNKTAPAATGNNVRLFAIIGVGALAAAAVGSYFYLQLQSLSQSGNRLAAPGFAAMPARNTAPAPITGAPPAAPTPIAASPSPTATPAAAPPSPAPAPVLVAEKPAAPASENSRAAPPRNIHPKPLVTARSPAGSSDSRPRPASATALASPEGLQITSRSQETPAVRAYNALQDGRFAEAKSAYAQALRDNPRDVDALLGLATLARRDGDTGGAADLYERVLQNDPRNASAVSGLLAQQGNGDPVQAESRLKSLIGLQNSDADATSALNFALGNLYAGQRRWAEAQQAYFRAHTADSGNPDTLYNLAISLEHLNQRPLARQFYQQALLAGRQRSAVFNRAEAENRLAALAP